MANYGRNCNNQPIITGDNAVNKAKLYAPVIPAEAVHIGIINGDGRTGAVIRLSNGQMVQANAGVIRTL